MTDSGWGAVRGGPGTLLAIILGIVGILGLTSAMTTSVVERTRELAVMKTLGATSGRIRRLILQEALSTSAISALIAILLSLPLTRAVEVLIGRLGFLAPLPFVVSSVGVLLWLVLLLVATPLATLPPAIRATRATVREALAAT